MKQVLAGDRSIVLGVYHHFKGKLYEVVDVVRDCDTLEYKVLYRALYYDVQKHIVPGDFFYMDVDEFLSDVDREKYPDVTQRERFKLVSPNL